MRKKSSRVAYFLSFVLLVALCAQLAAPATAVASNETTKKKVLFIILDEYADWEYGFLAVGLHDGFRGKASPYEVKTVSLTRDPIKSMGNFTTIPDYGIDDIPADYSGFVLIGGKSWRTEEAKKLVPIIQQAYADGKIVAAICDATVFLGMNGYLNEKKHTSNTLEDLLASAQGNYTGKENYLDDQAVRDGNLITANGTAYLEFTKETLTALNAYPAEDIESIIQYMKLGHVEFVKAMK